MMFGLIYRSVFHLDEINSMLLNQTAGVSGHCCRTGLQFQGYGDMQGFDSSSPAEACADNETHTQIEGWACRV